MQRLTMSIIKAVNTDYDYNFTEKQLKNIYNRLTEGDIVSMTDILEEFECEYDMHGVMTL